MNNFSVHLFSASSPPRSGKISFTLLLNQVSRSVIVAGPGVAKKDKKCEISVLAFHLLEDTHWDFTSLRPQVKGGQFVCKIQFVLHLKAT